MRIRQLSQFPLGAFLKALFKKLVDTDILGPAAQVAFYFLFALFPLLFFLVSLLGMVLDSSTELQAELFTFVRRIMPFSVYELIYKTLGEIIENSSGGKATIGLIVTLWSASAGFDAIRGALNSIYGLREQRYWWRLKIQSLLLTFLTAVLVAAVLYFGFYGWQFFQSTMAKVGIEVTSPIILKSVQWGIILVITLFACELIYNLLPAYKKHTWEWITPGSIAAIILWILLSAGFRVYLGYFNTYDRAYGSLGTVIIMLLWFYLTASAMMLGGAINAVLLDMRLAEDDR